MTHPVVAALRCVSGRFGLPVHRGSEGALIETSVPQSARVYDYWLGGKDNYAIRTLVRAQRALLVRVVRHLVGEVGITQFLDIGTGIPTFGTVHAVAQEVTSQAILGWRPETEPAPPRVEDDVNSVWGRAGVGRKL